MHGRALELELGSSTQTSHRLLAYSDALLSIIATVMVSPGLPGSVGTGGVRGAGSQHCANICSRMELCWASFRLRARK